MTFIDDWCNRAPQAMQLLTSEVGGTPDALTIEQFATALLWAIRDDIRAGEHAALLMKFDNQDRQL